MTGETVAMSMRFAACGCALCAGRAGDGFQALDASAPGTPSEAVPQGAISVLAIIAEDGTSRWNAIAGNGTGAVITYSFMTAVPSYDSTSNRPGFTAMSATQQAAARAALAQWAAVTGLTFVEVPDAVGGDIRFGTHDFSGTANDGFAGYAYYPTIGTTPAGAT